MKSKYLFIIYSLFFLPFYFVNAQDRDTIQSDSFIFAPNIAGGQFEATTLLYVGELGALVDIDLFKKQSKLNYSFGTRISFESYGYMEPGGPTGGGPFKDYCFFIMHSARSDKIHFNILGGISYHTRRLNFYSPDEFLFRVGIEIDITYLKKC